MIERIWQAITKRIVNNPKRIERIIRRGGYFLLDAKLVIPKIGEPLSTTYKRVIVIRGTVVMQSKDHMMTWVMTGDTFVNDPTTVVCGLEEGLAAVLVIGA